MFNNYIHCLENEGNSIGLLNQVEISTNESINYYKVFSKYYVDRNKIYLDFFHLIVEQSIKR